MIELAKHIEVLLLENDCVIVPGFGGFVAHYSSSSRVDEEELFLPPTRTVGFNPQIKMNDGLLVQSFMESYNTSFPDATKIVERKVDELRRILHEEGKITMPGVGELHQTIHDTYQFKPKEEGVFTPYLYGLSSFEMSELKAIQSRQEKKVMPEIPKKEKNVYEIRINRTFLRQTVAAAAAILVFFFMSTPVENTYVDKGNYAQLLSPELFKGIEAKPAIASQSGKENITSPVNQQPAATSKINIAQTNHKKTEAELKPRAVKVVKIEKSGAIKNITRATTPVPVSPGKVENNAGNGYNIIVASVVYRKDAQALADALKAKGYSGARVVEGNGRMRVSIMSLSGQNEANKKLAQLKQSKGYESAWLLTSN